MNRIRYLGKSLGKIAVALPIALLLCTHSLIGQANGAYKNAAEAIQAAQSKGQYVFVLFYDKKDSSFKAMESTINSFIAGSSKNILFQEAKTADDKEQDTVRKYGIYRSPLPVLLVFAPNGAITGGFPTKVSKEALNKSLVPVIVMNVLKSVQAGKIALVVLQNSKTKYNRESLKAVEDFSNDAKLKGYVDIIRADPGDPKNNDFMTNAQLSKDTPEASVVFIIPPGSIAGVYRGKITKDTLMTALAACSSGSCGSGGCSDRRFKKDISPIETPLDKVSKLNGVTFTWDREKYPLRLFPEGRKVGLIAQEVESVVPEVVNTDKDGYKSVEYDKLVALLVEGIKEMKQQIQKQDAVIQEQGKRIGELEAAVKAGGSAK